MEEARWVRGILATSPTWKALTAAPTAINAFSGYGNGHLHHQVMPHSVPLPPPSLTLCMAKYPTSPSTLDLFQRDFY